VHPAVRGACVVGVPHPAQGELIAAFVTLTEPATAGAALEAELLSHCRERLIKWSCPREIEVRAELPVTLLGKVDYRALVESRLDRQPR
jgi:long-chain acyl-CoA synthetase